MIDMKVVLAREIVGREFSPREAQDLPLDDLFELAVLISADVIRRDHEEVSL